MKTISVETAIRVCMAQHCRDMQYAINTPDRLSADSMSFYRKAEAAFMSGQQVPWADNWLGDAFAMVTQRFRIMGDDYFTLRSMLFSGIAEERIAEIDEEVNERNSMYGRG